MRNLPRELSSKHKDFYVVSGGIANAGDQEKPANEVVSHGHGKELGVTVIGKRPEHMGQVLGSTEHPNCILGFESVLEK